MMIDDQSRGVKEKDNREGDKIHQVATLDQIQEIQEEQKRGGWLDVNGDEIKVMMKIRGKADHPASMLHILNLKIASAHNCFTVNEITEETMRILMKLRANQRLYRTLLRRFVNHNKTLTQSIY